MRVLLFGSVLGPLIFGNPHIEAQLQSYQSHLEVDVRYLMISS